MENLLNWLEKNDVDEWSLSLSRNRQDNAYIFKSDIEADKDAEIERMKDILDTCEDKLIYVYASKKGARNAQFCQMWSNLSSTPTHVSASIGATPTYDEDYITAKVNAAIEANNLKWEKEKFERELADFKEEKKDYENKRSDFEGRLMQGVLGSPLGQKVLGMLGANLPKVAGVEGHSPETPPIKVIDEKKEEMEDVEYFSKEENQHLADLIEQWNEVDEEFISVLEKLVTFASSGKNANVMGMGVSYQKFKDLVLSIEL